MQRLSESLYCFYMLAPTGENDGDNLLPPSSVTVSTDRQRPSNAYLTLQCTAQNCMKHEELLHLSFPYLGPLKVYPIVKLIVNSCQSALTERTFDQKFLLVGIIRWRNLHVQLIDSDP